MSDGLSQAIDSAGINRPKRSLGRDPENVAKAEQVIALIEEGAGLRVALESIGMGRTMFMSALASERAIAQRYARALEASADFLVDEAIDAARNHPDVNRARVIADINRWAAGKRNSRVYGDRIDLNVSQQLDVRAVLVDAQARRLRTISDQRDTLELQVIDNAALPPPEPADTQSAAPVVPPIFSEKSGPAADELDIFS